ncbi:MULTISPECIES: hypothetical protein [unclassified Lysinibacillus]|nr:MULTISPECIES: hypothetical protein [unclassified Lysinibacillus]
MKTYLMILLVQGEQQTVEKTQQMSAETKQYFGRIEQSERELAAPTVT